MAKTTLKLENWEPGGLPRGAQGGRIENLRGWMKVEMNNLRMRERILHSEKRGHVSERNQEFSVCRGMTDNCGSQRGGLYFCNLYI